MFVWVLEFFGCRGTGKGKVGEEMGKHKLLSAKEGAVKSDNKLASASHPYAIAAFKTLHASATFQEHRQKSPNNHIAYQSCAIQFKQEWRIRRVLINYSDSRGIRQIQAKLSLGDHF